MGKIQRKLLYICEGASEEPALIKKMMDSMHSGVEYKVYSYGTNIHVLADILDKEYPDFDNGDTDIKLILSSIEPDSEKKNLLAESFSDILLVFDFDPHHDGDRFAVIKRMIAYYKDSTDMGKLYVNLTIQKLRFMDGASP